MTLWDRINNNIDGPRTGMVRELEDRVDARVLRWFGHMVRMDDERLVEMVMKSEVSGCWPRSMPKFEWMDSVSRR